MIRRYGLLFAAALALAGLLALLQRGARSDGPAGAKPMNPPVTMTLGIYGDSVLAVPAAVPVGTTIELAITNVSDAPARLSLAGYEDRVDSGVLEPDGSKRITFLADRPGERFAWMVGGRPRGRLDVTGSHLVEGHR